MTKKEARIILGVTKETSRESIERRYGMYLKRYRLELGQAKIAAKQELEENQNDSADATKQGSTAGLDEAQRSLKLNFDQITQAYNVLMGYDVTLKEEPPSKVAPLLKKVGLDEKKTKNFFFYYKYHILVGILLIIAIAFIIRGYANRVNPDFNLAFIGRFDYSTASDDLAERIKANIPEILEPGIDGAYIAEDSFGEQEYAMEMKATVLVVAGNIDVFIMDKACFQRYAQQGAFVNLDDIAPRLGVNLEENEEFIVKIQDDSEETEDGSSEDSDTALMPEKEHLYGIDISDSAVLRQSGVVGNEMIASIHVGGKQIDKAQKLIQFLME